MTNKNILFTTGILGSSSKKTLDAFVQYISADFTTTNAHTPHDYVKNCWNNYTTGCPNSKRSQSLNGKIFETVIETCFYREGILPMFLQANVTFVPNVFFDVVLFNGEKNAPIGISLKTSLRERYKQADLEAVALKYVHRNAENYLISLQSDEVDTVKEKLKHGELLGLNHIIAADTVEFDELIAELKNMTFIQPEKVEVVSGNIVKGV